ncbi:MAG: DUF4276 family protein, partial [bacterium]|nr:DUF4276 family protein [bacterium]
DYSQKVESVEKLFAHDIGSKRFLPYLQLHEFEALIFVEPGQLDKISHMSLSGQLEKVKASFKSPEEINDNPETAPSRRILKVYPKYRKTTQGPVIVRRIGLDKIRVECKHFDWWISTLEKLGKK